MFDRTKAAPGPSALAFGGFVLSRVFLVFTVLAQLRRGIVRRWLSVATATIALVLAAPGLGPAKVRAEVDPSLFMVKNYGGEGLGYGVRAGDLLVDSCPAGDLKDCAR